MSQDQRSFSQLPKVLQAQIIKKLSLDSIINLLSVSKQISWIRQSPMWNTEIEKEYPNIDMTKYGKSDFDLYLLLKSKIGILEIVNVFDRGINQDLTNWIGNQIPPLVKLSQSEDFIIAGSTGELYHTTELRGFEPGLGSLFYYGENEFGPVLKNVKQVTNEGYGLILFQNGELFLVTADDTRFTLKLIATNVKVMGQDRNFSYSMAYYITQNEELFVSSNNLDFKFVETVQLAKVILSQPGEIAGIYFVTKSNFLKRINNEFIIQTLGKLSFTVVDIAHFKQLYILDNTGIIYKFIDGQPLRFLDIKAIKLFAPPDIGTLCVVTQNHQLYLLTDSKIEFWVDRVLDVMEHHTINLAVIRYPVTD